jgi:hypothetical protein
VIDVAGAPGFYGIVADFRYLLVTVEGFDGDVDIEDLR